MKPAKQNYDKSFAQHIYKLDDGTFVSISAFGSLFTIEHTTNDLLAPVIVHSDKYIKSCYSATIGKRFSKKRFITTVKFFEDNHNLIFRENGGMTLNILFVVARKHK